MFSGIRELQQQIPVIMALQRAVDLQRATVEWEWEEQGGRSREGAGAVAEPQTHAAVQPQSRQTPKVLMALWVVLAFLLSAAAGEHLTRKVGEDVTFSLGDGTLKQDDMLVWSCGPETWKEKVLFSIHVGKYDGPTQSGRFQVDLTTGSLTIKGLLANDSAVCQGQIFNGNGTNRCFNLTVEEPDPIQPIQPIQPAVEPPVQAAAGIIIAVLVVLFILGLIYLVKKKKLGSGTPV
ncbi:uncharacterized protein FYW61_005907 [Anableps anableps]